METVTEQLIIINGWVKPIPLESSVELPPFPTNSLCDVGKDMVEAVAAVNQVDTGMVGTIFLSILSTCLSKKALVDLITHMEPVNLYTCSILPSGERKSQTVGIMSRPIYEYQYLSDQMELTLVIDDVTPEKLGSLMANNDERMAILSAEGGVFHNINGRYGNKQKENMDLYLKAHAGDSWSAHRMTRAADIMVSPSLTISLSAQPELVKNIGTNKALRGRGLLARFLYSYCTPRAGTRKRQTQGLSDDLLEQYGTHVVSLLEIPLEISTLRLTQDAQSAWDEYYDSVEHELRPDGRLSLLLDWGSKLSGAVARISGLLHISKHGACGLKTPIETTTVQSAIAIGEYYMEHAIATFGLMAENPHVEAAKKIIEFIKRDDIKHFKGRDVIRSTGLRTMDEVKPGLKVLIERGHLREVQPERPQRGRPEAATYHVNPLIWE